MYQALHYDYFSRTAHLRDDELGWQTFQYYPTYYKLDPKGEYKTLDGKRVSVIKKLDKEDPEIYEKDVDKCLSILLDVYKEDTTAPKWHNKVFLDIEIQLGGAINLEFCQKAPSKVTAIALYDVNTKQYFVYVLDESKYINVSNKEGITIIPCYNEQSLLISFLDKWIEIDPTIVATWNGDSFDIPYLYNRMKKMIGTDKANSLSPIDIVYFDERDTKMPYKIAGVNSMDMMRLYKKFIPKQQPSYSLDAISMKELKKGKLKYEGSLDHLFKTDIDKFIEYNVNDVRLLVELDEKLQFIDLAINVSHLGHVPYHYVYQSSKLLEGVIMTHLKSKNIVSPNKPTTINPELRKSFDDESEDDDKFAGAYVKEPVPGLYGWNIDLDETSLYPCLMLQLNSSPETLICRIVKDDPIDTTWSYVQIKQKNGNDKVTIENIDGQYKTISINRLIKFIDDNNIITSPNGVFFSSDEMGFLCEIVQQWFDMRKSYKNKMKDAGKANDKNMYNFYNLTQSIYKILLNSIYGCMGLASFRYTDGKDIMAEAITVSGRFVITSTADWIDQKINKEIYDI